MFGTYRVILAVTVVFVHFTQMIAELSGLYAVFGFFMLSGYLMTLIMHESYGYSRRGILGFAFNRFLRIYPMYWFTVIMALGVILLVADVFPDRAGKFFMPETASQWFRNLALVLEFTTVPQIILPAWTLTIELFFYGLIGLGLSRTKVTTILWLVASLAYTAWLLLSGASDYDRMFTVRAASLPFAIGAALYHWREPMARPLKGINTTILLPVMLLGLFFLNIVMSHGYGVQQHIGLYVNLLLCGLLLLSLHNRSNLSPISAKADALMGNLSYPIYLVHAPLSGLLLYLCILLGLPISGPSLLAFCVWLPPTILVAWLISVSIEAPIDRLRTRVKRAL
jgi:peptidoglycan/LPS O-acetylase OafA/YrhL